MISREQIGALLKKLRAKRKLTGRELGAMAGVSHMEIYRIERGVAYPRIDTLDMLFKALGYKFIIGGSK